MQHHNEKMKELIREYAGEYLARESTDASLITITGVEVTSDSKRATILFTAIPESKEEAVYGFIKRNLGEMRDYIKTRVRTHSIPYLDVRKDFGEKHRQHIDELLRIEKE